MAILDPFASSSEEDFDDSTSTEALIKRYGEKQVVGRHRRERKQWKALSIHIAAIALYGIVAALSVLHLNRLNSRRIVQDQHLIYSPADEAIRYKQQVYKANLRGDAQYFGEPGQEVDDNWRQLLWPSTIHLSESERQHYDPNMPIVQFPDGTYQGQLMVYHELHCLKRLYHYINAEHYMPNMTEEDRVLEKMHTSHCLGTLRQGIMCHGDISVMPLVWGKNNPIPLGDFSNPHQCVDFDALHAWATDRAVTDALEPGVLVHPTLGPSFPGGVGTKVGFGVKDLDEDGNIITFGTNVRS